MKFRSVIVYTLLGILSFALAGLAVVQGATTSQTPSTTPGPGSAVVSTSPLVLAESQVCSVDRPPASVTVNGNPASPASVFTETFDGEPSSPQPFSSPRWDVTVHSRDRDTWDELESMAAAHGNDCSPPPATHEISAYEDAVYTCRNHLMTAINASGYGLIYLTPNHLVDFSQGEAVIRFDVSTLRTSSRDWIDVWITPPEDHLQLALDEWLPDLSGEPRNAVHIRMDGRGLDTVFRAAIIRDFETVEEPENLWWVGYGNYLEPSATRRDTFEIRISRTHLQVGLPAYDFWWIDEPIQDLGWSRGTVQFGHHSYNPTKDFGGGSPTTWHWDNITIAPAVPFTIQRAQQREATRDAATVQFAQPAVEGANLRFAGIGPNLEVSFDGGTTWQPARRQPQEINQSDVFSSYMMPIPAGVDQVQFRGSGWCCGDWRVRDISWWYIDPSATAGSPGSVGNERLWLPLVRR